MTNPYAPPTARVDDVVATTAEAAPKLWNPNAAVNWSLLLIVALSLASGLMPDSRGLDAATRSFGLVLLVAWYVSAGRAQATLVKQRFGKDYQRKGWAQPLLWAVGAVIGFFALVFVIAFAAGMAGAE